MSKRCLQEENANAHHQVSPLLTNELDTSGLGDVIVCELKAGGNEVLP